MSKLSLLIEYDSLVLHPFFQVSLACLIVPTYVFQTIDKWTVLFLSGQRLIQDFWERKQDLHKKVSYLV